MKPLPLIALLCLAMTLPPLPPKPKHRHRDVPRGAQLLLTLNKVKAKVVAPPLRIVTSPWRYAPGYTNYFWDLQSSRDLRNWSTIATNCTGDLWATNNRANPMLFYRLKGRLP
jgi:hypothetical protein